MDDTNAKGYTALMETSQWGHADVAAVLLKGGKQSKERHFEVTGCTDVFAPSTLPPCY